jgi:sortase A
MTSVNADAKPAISPPTSEPESERHGPDAAEGSGSVGGCMPGGMETIITDATAADSIAAKPYPPEVPDSREKSSSPIAVGGHKRAATLRPMRRARRLLSWTLVLTGVLIGAWTVTVWRWQDPVTALYTSHRQAQLSSDLRRSAKTFVASLPQEPAAATSPRKAPSAAALRRLATSYASHVPEGGPLGKLVIPRLGLHVTFVNGTNTAALRGGPGRDERTGLPGQHRLVYIAGHRTTFGAPFANIDRLQPGDAIVLELPYAVFTYHVTGTRIVDAHDLSVLRPGTRELVVLQACHPRFFATQRLLVYAVPTHVAPPPKHF